MDHSRFWNSYLRAPASDAASDAAFDAGLEHCRNAFAHQRETLSRIIQALRPDSVAVLGAGYLNDVPLADLVDGQTKILLVEWKEDSTRIGMARSIVRSSDGRHHCLFCKTLAGGKYCRNFCDAPRDAAVCPAFRLESFPVATCAEYVPADEPVFLRADVTGGVATRFATIAEKIVATGNNPKDVFVKAIKAADAAKPGALPLADRSVELVSSSMVLSQFDVEPYGYFARLLEERFGREEITRHEAKLVPMMEQLRTRLFLAQVEAHVKEMARILKQTAKSRAYLSTEFFRSYPDGGVRYFLVQDIARALEIVGRYFDFDFELAAPFENAVVNKSVIGDGTSVTQSYLLVPKFGDATALKHYAH